MAGSSASVPGLPGTKPSSSAWAQITVSGDGTPVRSYMDQRDLARWLEVLLLQGCAGQAYNVGSDVAISIAELAHRVRDLLAPGKPVHIAMNDVLTAAYARGDQGALE